MSSRSSINGLAAMSHGVRLLKEPGIRGYVIVPLVINVILFALVIVYSYGQFELFLGWLRDWLPSWLLWIDWLLIPFFVVTALFVLFTTFTFLANLIGAPFNSLLAERIERYLTGETITDESGEWYRVLIDFIPQLWNEVNKMLHALLWSIPFLVFFLIPGLNLAAPFLWILFSCWMMALQYLDVPMSNHGWKAGQVRRALRQQRLLSLGFGGVVLLMSALPFVNFLAMPASVAGATVLWVARYSRERPD